MAGHGGHGTKEEDDVEIGPLATKTEIMGWWIFDFASSIFVYSVLPFLLTGFLTSVADEEAVGGYVNFMGSKMQPKSFFRLMITASVLVQTPIFIAVGAVADVGGYRRKLLIITSVIACLICGAFFLVMKPIPYWVAGAMLVLNNIAVGTASIFYNSFLPLLVKNYPKVREATDPAEKKEMAERVGNRISSVGINAGFAGGTIFLILNIIIYTIVPTGCSPGCSLCTPAVAEDHHLCPPESCPAGYDANNCDHAYWGTRVNLLLAAVWWLGFSIFTFHWLKDRVSPPLPPGEHIMTHSFKKMLDIAKTCHKLPTATKFIFGYWIYSDGMNTLFISLTETAMADLQFTSQEAGVLTIFINLSAMAGNFFFLYLNKRRPDLFSAKIVIGINLAMFAVMPLYVLIPGTVEGKSLKAQWYILSLLYGFGFASIQGFSRGLLSRMAPPGCEGAFFSFFEFTNKLTSPLGPLLTTAVLEKSESWRLSAFSIVLFLVGGGILLGLVNEEKGYREAQSYVPVNHMEMSAVGHGADDDDEDERRDFAGNSLEDEDDDRVALTRH